MPKIRFAGARVAQLVAVAVALGSTGLAMAQETPPATALAALQGVSTGNTGYGPVMWGMAALTVGIMIGVKWIKRGRGAA